MLPCTEHTQKSTRYGYTSILGRSVLLHRKVYADHNGLDPFTMGGVVMHTCDNPRCVEPTHLVFADQSANIRDMYDKGRGAVKRGEASPAAKVDEDAIRYIRAYEGKQKDLMVQFGLSQAQISRIRGGSRWKHLQ